MKMFDGLPCTAYGILQRDVFNSEQEEVAEQVRRLGYAVLDSGYSNDKLEEISDAFNQSRANYVNKWGEYRLKEVDEINSIRALLTHGDPIFLHLAMNHDLITVLQKLIMGKIILNQQNGIINPAQEKYNQGSWHRDLPYQHFVSNSPLAVNALFCVDDFTVENGSTFVLPASHKTAAFPSENYVQKNSIQVEAKAGSFIILDCMLYHSGGFNKTMKDRRAINHVYTIPYFKQQINLPENMRAEGLSDNEREWLGFGCQAPVSIENYLVERSRKVQK